jgi:aryl-alcohol dehydrogenase-like predicted oxidoreductase
MRYLPLGRSGLLVSVVGLGCNNFGSRLDVAGTRAVVDSAIDAGITLFDTSDTYGNGGGSETALGEVLGRRRDQVVLATKFGHQGVDMGYGPAAGAKGGRSYIRRAVTESLRRLRTDYIDLYQLHTPDPVTPIEETIAALDELVSEGKVRYLGHSNLSGWQLADAAHLAARDGHTPFISAQNHWSLLERGAESEVVPAARHFGLGVLPFFPLANGLLTGKVRRGQPVPSGTRLASREGYVTQDKLARVEALIAWGQEHGVTLLEIAIGGLAAQPGCSSVIAGAMNPEQVKANANAAEWIPSAGELAEIDALAPPPAEPRHRPPTGTAHRPGSTPTDRPAAPAEPTSASRHRRAVERRHVRPEHGRIGDCGSVAALLVPADDPDQRALPRRRVDRGEERPAARPVGVGAAVEFELVLHRLLGPVLAGDGLVRTVRVADDLHELTGRRPGSELFGSSHVLDRDDRAGLADPQEGDVVVRVGRGAPCLVDVDGVDRPHAVRGRPFVIAGHEHDNARR